eukprot:scaffold7470_cov92-Isochrysis_galbana.AAC.1
MPNVLCLNGPFEPRAPALGMMPHRRLTRQPLELEVLHLVEKLGRERGQLVGHRVALAPQRRVLRVQRLQRSLQPSSVLAPAAGRPARLIQLGGHALPVGGEDGRTALGGIGHSERLLQLRRKLHHLHPLRLQLHPNLLEPFLRRLAALPRLPRPGLVGQPGSQLRRSALLGAERPARLVPLALGRGRRGKEGSGGGEASGQGGPSRVRLALREAATGPNTYPRLLELRLHGLHLCPERPRLLGHAHVLHAAHRPLLERRVLGLQARDDPPHPLHHSLHLLAPNRRHAAPARRPAPPAAGGHSGGDDERLVGGEVPHARLQLGDGQVELLHGEGSLEGALLRRNQRSVQRTLFTTRSRRRGLRRRPPRRLARLHPRCPDGPLRRRRLPQRRLRLRQLGRKRFPRPHLRRCLVHGPRPLPLQTRRRTLRLRRQRARGSLAALCLLQRLTGASQLGLGRRQLRRLCLQLGPHDLQAPLQALLRFPTLERPASRAPARRPAAARGGRTRLNLAGSRRRARPLLELVQLGLGLPELAAKPVGLLHSQRTRNLQLRQARGVRSVRRAPGRGGAVGRSGRRRRPCLCGGHGVVPGLPDFAELPFEFGQRLARRPPPLALRRNRNVHRVLNHLGRRARRRGDRRGCACHCRERVGAQGELRAERGRAPCGTVLSLPLGASPAPRPGPTEKPTPPPGLGSPPHAAGGPAPPRATLSAAPAAPTAATRVVPRPPDRTPWPRDAQTAPWLEPTARRSPWPPGSSPPATRTWPNASGRAPRPSSERANAAAAGGWWGGSVAGLACRGGGGDGATRGIRAPGAHPICMGQRGAG